ncbi:MAG: type II toxin-antitoxin system VapC family toxin [Pseudonocardia sp.]
MAKAGRRSRVPVGVSDLLVLDAEGVSKAATNNRSVQAWLERARELDADVVISAATVAEVVRGVGRDADCERVIKSADVWPVDEALARQAGRLLGRTRSQATIDAFVAVTAVTARQHNGSARCVVLTSDPHDLAMLLSDEPGISVIRV